EPVRLDTVQASDLVVTGGSVTGVEVLDSRTLRFSVSVPNTEGTYPVSLPAGALLDLQGQPSAVFASTFQIDHTGPHVVSQAPALQASAPFTQLTLTFDEDVNPATFPLSAITSFVGPGGVNLNPQLTSVTGSGRTYTVHFNAQTAQGTYTMQLAPVV